MYVLMLDTHIPMFSGTLIDYDINQRMFLYWLRFYNQNVFSLPLSDRPSDVVVDYDILLDEYIDHKEFQDKTKTSSRTRASAEEMNEVISFGN